MLAQLKSWVWTHRRDLLIAAALFLLAAVPRLTNLGTFLTADEKTWIERSHDFVLAFHDGRFNDMLQTTHPGVTVLWVVGIVVQLKLLLAHVPTPFDATPLIFFVKTTQLTVALMNTLLIPAAYLLLRRLGLRRALAGIATLFLALDPFVIGYSRVVHVDALMGGLMWLAGISILIYAREHFSRRWLVIAAILSALALLTKFPAIFLLPFLVLTMLVYQWPGRFSKEWWKRRAIDLVWWIGIILVMFIVIWPALLFVPNPKGNVLVVKRDLVEASTTTHGSNGDYSLNPWHYPAALLIRSTPVLLVLVPIGVIGLALSWRRRVFQREGWLVVGYVLAFTVMMTLGAKKGDRYIVPVWPALTLLGAYGAVYLSRIVAPTRRRVGLIAVVALSTIVLVVTVARYHPYEISYSSPFFPDNLSQELGWGEGLDHVAAWLNQHDPQAHVASWYPEELGAFTSAPVSNISAHQQFNFKYVVLYRNMFGRDPANSANDFIDEYYKKREPVFISYVVGKPFAWVYEKRIYERVIDELVPGVVAVQPMTLTHDNLSGFDLALATYTGRAKDGTVHIELSDATTHRLLYSWQLGSKDIKDSTWTTVHLPSPLHLAGSQVLVSVQTQGTHAGDAPTLRFSLTPYRPQPYTINGKAKTGTLAIRPRYQVGTQEATEEDTKLLKQP